MLLYKHVCVWVRFHLTDWSNIHSNTWRTSLNKPLGEIVRFAWCIPFFLCVCVCVSYSSVFQRGGSGNYLFGIPGQSFMPSPRGSHWKRGGYWLSDPPDFLSSLLFTPSPFSAWFHVSSLLSTPHCYRYPSPCHLNPFLSNLQLILKAATVGKEPQIKTAWFDFSGNRNQSGIKALVCWRDQVFPFSRNTHREHAAMLSDRLLWVGWVTLRRFIHIIAQLFYYFLVQHFGSFPTIASPLPIHHYLDSWCTNSGLNFTHQNFWLHGWK